jgi:flagellar biosynthesis anti-sigma factor FlgM
MKIDPRVPITPDPQSDRVSNAVSNRAQTNGSARGGGVVPAAGEDTVSLSSAHTDVQRLTASVAAVPEVRASRVNALQQQVSRGQYQPKSQDIADAILTDLPGLNVKA